MKNSVLCYLEETVKRYPDKTAFVDEDKSITFLELHNRALQVAHDLMEKYGKRKQPVLVYMPKTVESICCFMGVLYSGNFYTPTDIRFPFEKVSSIIETLHPEVIIGNTETLEKLQTNGVDANIKLINVDQINSSDEFHDSAELVDQILDTDPVYTFFTSGSTGTPKGVVITNHNIIDYTDWAVKTFDINQTTIMGNQSPFYFDISTQDIYSTLKSGATLAIIPVKAFSFPVLALKFIKEKHINFLYWVPSAFVNISNFKLLEKICLDEVHTIMFGGEVMPVKHMNYWKKYLPNLKMIANVYGPTEATVNCTYYIVDRDFEDSDVLPLGKACENTGLMLLDENRQLIDQSKTGCMGELCVYGSSLSPGYWDDPDKTDEKYIANPLNTHYVERMYLTGDLVYYNDRGELVFAGRKDFQIKHMGYRIELGEIEAAALGIDGVEQACADYMKESKKIVLYVVAAKKELNKEIVVEKLSNTIPKYMVPADVIMKKHFPLNDNGKVDRKVLHEEYTNN